MKRILLATAAGLVLPSLAWAADARLGYTTTTGAAASVMPITAVCSVSSDGTPQLCKDGLLGDGTNGIDGRLAYKNTNGSFATAMPVVPVCSVVDGVPQVCDFSGGGTFYLSSNAWGTYHIGVGGHLYIVDIFGSGAGKRTFMSWRMVK